VKYDRYLRPITLKNSIFVPFGRKQQ